MTFVDGILLNTETLLRRSWERPPSYDPDYVLLASFPKSGNTWMRFILSNLSRLAGGHDLEVSFQSIGRYTPEIRRNRRLAGAIRTPSFPLFLKTHFPFVPAFGRFRSFLLVRNPADVMVSLRAHLVGQGRIAPDFPLSRLIRSARRGVPAWVHFHRRWVGRETVLLRYEDLLRDTAGAVAAALDRLGCRMDPASIGEAVALSSKENMLRIRQELGDPCSRNPDFFFVRKGVSGEGLRRLSPDDLGYLVKKTRPLAERLGYGCFSPFAGREGGNGRGDE